MRMLSVGISVCLCGVVLAGCGEEAGGPRTSAAALPESGRAYRGLDDMRRAAVAAGCRDRAAGATRGAAARELAAIDPTVLRERLDSAYRVTVEQRRPVAAVCRETIPFVTPGLTISIDGATDNHGGTFTVQTTSDKPLTISGRVAPAGRGRVIARRELRPVTRAGAAIGPDGRFRLPAMRLRKVADNTFTIAIQAPPHAPRAVLFSAICLDCLAGGPGQAPPSGS
jgi:hypothetical protein